MRPYIVRQGDYVTKIAMLVGCDEDEVWAHEKNQELKEKGRTKEILAPGDVLFIPEGDRNTTTIFACLHCRPCGFSVVRRRSS